MAEIRTVTTLRYKRTEILSSIENYKERLARAICWKLIQALRLHARQGKLSANG